jgi:hypothetical protein
MTKYKIADMLLEIKETNLNLTKRFESFTWSGVSRPDLTIFLNGVNTICKPTGEVMVDESVSWVKEKKANRTTISFVCSGLYDENIAMFKVDEEWKQASVFCVEDKASDDYNFTGLTGETLFRNFILMHQGIGVHASAIEWEGKGIIFSAPSGTGKSTQAHLWKAYKGAKIINGDRPVVRLVNDKPYVYGTPWTATSPDYLNARAPLSAIVMLSQANTNSIRELSKNETLIWLMPRCFLPYHDKKLMELAIQNIENIIKRVPVYLLECRPDKEAVELVHQCIK